MFCKMCVLLSKAQHVIVIVIVTIVVRSPKPTRQSRGAKVLTPCSGRRQMIERTKHGS